ncbi:type II secretion system F family protein [Kovacikia minuta CCNUW1]|uniref:type II secretion system F family protein n=1 Tax=Kovacikia minuta TaxID=2931930 RepID=UPI001CCB361F|nr:type II secretion system F family protein [Kovacikia minuta]UBF26137.1 type II secretion system F family protein [Kovacikia minuta CCNUW1]
MRESARFFGQFAALLKAGLSVQQSLSMVGKDCSPALQRVLREANLKIEMGQDLATALEPYPHYFDRWTISLIRTSEYSGALGETFERLAIAAEVSHRRQRLYRSIQRSIFLILLGLGALLFLLTQGGTIFLLQPSFWLMILVLVVGLLVATRLLGSRSMGQEVLRSLPQFPLVGGIVQARAMLYLTELELPLRCGVPILQALQLVRCHIPDREMAAGLAIASHQIQAGKTLSQSLKGRLTPLAAQMLRTGEETGNLEGMLEKVSEYYERDLECRLKQLQGILRPLGIIAIGGLVLLSGVQGINSLLRSLPG